MKRKEEWSKNVSHEDVTISWSLPDDKSEGTRSLKVRYRERDRNKGGVEDLTKCRPSSVRPESKEVIEIKATTLM